MTTHTSRRTRRQMWLTHPQLKVTVLLALGLNVLALFGQVVL